MLLLSKFTNDFLSQKNLLLHQKLHAANFLFTKNEYQNIGLYKIRNPGVNKSWVSIQNQTFDVLGNRFTRY